MQVHRQYECEPSTPKPMHLWVVGTLFFASLVLYCSAATNVRAQAARVDYENSTKPDAVRQEAEWRLAFRPSPMVVRQTVSQLRSAPGVSADVSATVDSILSRPPTESPESDLKSLMRAAALLMGKTWTPQQEVLSALALKAPDVWSDKDGKIDVFADYPAQAPNVEYGISLYKSAPTSSATPKKGALVGRLAEGELSSLPQTLNVVLQGVPDGAYLLQADFHIGAETGLPAVASIYVIHHLTQRYTELQRQLAGVQGHDDAKQTAEYPFYLGQAMFAGKREVISYDFPSAMKQSEQIVHALQAGSDPVWQAKGLQDRAYKLEGTDDLIPYQLYVPSNWSPSRKWSLVVALHGANLDEKNMLGRGNGQMQNLAEQYGYVVIAPLGYRLNSAYGNERMFDALGSKKRTEDDRRRVRLSEEDVLELTKRIGREYNIDPSRRYLTGNSMGGGGTWWIGGHYPDMWAAIAPAAFGGVLPDDVPGLSHVPILAVVGDHDELGMQPRVRQSVATLQAGGAHVDYLEIPGGTHKTAYDVAMPAIFKFFSTHEK